MPFPHVGQDHPAIQWVSASKGYIPENAFRVSGKAIGRGIDVYGGIQPGYISKSKKALVVEHSHQQMLISKYEVLVPARGYSALTENETLFDWIPMSGTLDQTKFNFTPLKVGTEHGNRDELYIARIWDDGKWIIGKAGNPLPGIHYVASGVAKIGQNYEILAIKSRLDLNKNSISEMKNLNKFALKEWVELISDPIKLSNKNQLVFEHSDLPMVSNELSVTLQLKLQSHISNWATIFHKGTDNYTRTPGFWLTANKSKLHARFTGNWDRNAGIYELGNGLMLNKWYHLTYTLSDSEKRLDIYVNGEWAGFYSIQDVQTQKVIFNDGPLYIGQAFSHSGFNGEIRNFRYFNWRLTAEEAKKDFYKNKIKYGSKVALVHMSTGKFLSTKGVKYDLGPNNKQYMVICSGQEMDSINDVWTIVGAHDEDVNMGGFISFNSIIGFKHQSTGVCLHSHGTGSGVTSKSKYQQVTLCKGRNADDDWLIRRFNPDASYSCVETPYLIDDEDSYLIDDEESYFDDDSYLKDDDDSYLINEDVISLFHIRTGKPALYSHPILLDDGSQEVCCRKNGSNENNKWIIKLIE